MTGSNFKTAGKIIPSTDATNNKPVNLPTRGADNWEFSLNEVGIGLVIIQLVANAFMSIVPMAVHVLGFGGDSTPRDHKNIVN